MRESLGTAHFQEAMRRTFVKVGLAPDEDGEFVQYRAHLKNGFLSSMLEKREAALVAESQGPTYDVATFGEIASEFVIEPRN